MPIDLSNLEDNLKVSTENKGIEITSISNYDIAVIGISCKFGKSNNKDQFWESLKNGEDHIRPVPGNRRKMIETYFAAQGVIINDEDYQEGAYLNEIDKFDYELFSISPLEANLMSPNQRIFLQAAWAAIEDAGYGGKKIQGSKTGIFLGHTTDFGVSYKRYVEACNEELAGLSMSGNLNSTIASRIAYLLDLRGPSLLVDTACSSSLSAIHLACQSIRNNECKMALAGAVRVDLSPVKQMEKIEDIGISSSNRRARTFDASSDGTGDGEGVGAVLLKPLYKAIEDGDYIYAVIKGSAMNQDGKSVGMTAPNPEAQKSVILEAWNNADISPETITYIEAHGTGTKLGDPIEVSGIERAFKQWTNKKQFCGIGSVKTNVGHLDCAAGMAGFIKLVLSLKNGELPPTINFNTPNKKIKFEDSPVYVNDRHRKWVTDGCPRRGGVSAFGLSGTNCHIVVEEPPVRRNCHNKDKDAKAKIFVLSAKSKQALLGLIRKFQLYFYKEKNDRIDDICYTLATGRMHFTHRLSIIFTKTEELKKKLQELYLSDLSVIPYGSFYKKHRIVSKQQESRKDGEITSEIQDEISLKANKLLISIATSSLDQSNNELSELCSLYVEGADINWEDLYRGQKNFKISLPTYSFLENSCWVVPGKNNKSRNDNIRKTMAHPLFETCLSQSFDRATYLSNFQVEKDWVLNEHRVAGVCVIPGTTYLEMITEYIRKNYPDHSFHLKDVFFLTPLSVDDYEMREVQTIVNDTETMKTFTIVSRKEDWIKHVEGKILLEELSEKEKLNLEDIRSHCNRKQLKEYSYNPDYSIEVGPRWNCLKDTFVGENEILGCLSLDGQFTEEAETYHLHPALLDEAVNIAIRTIGEGIYLPFCYKELQISGDLPKKIFSYIRKTNENSKNQEFASFDVIIMDEDGNIIVRAKDYKVKKVDESKMFLGSKLDDNSFYKFNWIQKLTENEPVERTDNFILVLKGRGNLNHKILEKINQKYANTIEVDFGGEFQTITSDKYVIPLTEDGYKRLFKCIENKVFDKVIFLCALSDEKEIKTVKEFEEKEAVGIYNFYHLIRSMVKNRLDNKIDIIIIGQYAYEVDKSEQYLIPLTASLFGFGKVVNEEYPKLKCRCIDIDDLSNIDILDSIFDYICNDYIVSYRLGNRYVAEFDIQDLAQAGGHDMNIKKNGLYLITGGTGGIGLEIAGYISAKTNAVIALINRTPFPLQSQWDSILANDSDEKLCNKIRMLQKIKANGSTVVLYSTDISNINETRNMINDLQRNYGTINGVFHCAGVAGNGFIINRDEEAIRNVLSPKTKGTWILNELTKGMKLDFFVMFSSISSFITEPGQGDYIAANCFLDSFSAYNDGAVNNKITINWPAWQEIGMAVDYGVNMNDGLFKPIKTKKAMEILDIIFEKMPENVIVGKINPNSLNQSRNLIDFRLSESVELNLKTNQTISKTKTNIISEVKLKGKENDSEFTEMEKILANIMGKVLGLNEINIYDSFLEIGGNSLLAVKVELAMEECQIPVSVIDLYNYGSVKELAEHLSGKSTDHKKTKETMLKEKQIEAIEPFEGILYKSCFHNAVIPVINVFTNNDLSILASNDVFAFEFLENDEIGNARINDIFHKTLQELMNSINIKIKTKTHKSNKPKEHSLTQEQIFKLDRVSQYIGIQKEKETNNINRLLTDIKTSLSRGRFVCIWVDCFYESIRKDTYKKEHLLHTLLLYGFDDTKKVFYGLEHNHKDNVVYKKLPISYEDIVNSYEGFLMNYSEYSNVPTFYEFYLDDSAMIKPDYKKIFAENVNNNKEKIVSGLINLDLFFNKLCDILEDEIKLNNNADIIINALNSIISDKQIEKFNLSTLYGEKIVMMDNIKQVIDMWSNIRHDIVKFNFSKLYQPEKIENIRKLCNKILKVEQEYIRNLFEFLNI